MAKVKSNSIITHEVTADGIVFNVLGAGAITLDLRQVNPVITQRAMFHGLIQRVSDAAALSRDTATGLPATPAEKFEEIRALVEHYNSGTVEWSLKRAGGGADSSGGLLVRALLECFPNKGVERIREYLKGLTAAQKTALSDSDRVKPIIDRMRAEVVKHIDAEELIAGL